MFELKEELFKDVLSDFVDEIEYFPLSNPIATILLTQSTLHCSLRFLACVVDLRIFQEKVNTELLQDRMKKIRQSPHMLPILKPFTDPNLEALDTSSLLSAYKIVEPLSILECLIIMGILYERSHWELLIPSANSRSVGKQTRIYTNLAFTNKKGIFYTPPEVASFIVKRTFGNILSEYLASMETEDFFKVKNHLIALFHSKACDPACGSSIFMLYFLKELFDAFPKIYELAHKNGISLKPENKLKEEVISSIIYGVDVQQEAIQLSRIMLCLFSGLSLDEIPTLETKLKTGNALISDEILGSPKRPRKKKKRRSLDRFFLKNMNLVETFNWSEEYPELNIYDEKGGFDYIFMNPPYGRLKIHRSDFVNKETISSFFGKKLDSKLHNNRSHLKNMSRYFRKSGDYVLSCKGELDWHRLMVERALRLLKHGGRIGCIIPSTILADLRSAPLRKYLLKSCTIEEAYTLPETANLFDTVNQPTCILIIRKDGEQRTPIAVTKCENSKDLWNTKSVMISVDTIRTLNPEILPIPIIDEWGYLVLEKLHQYKPIGNNSKLANMRGELDLTANRSFVSDNEEDILLIRGDNVERFVCRPSSESRKEARVKSDFLQNIKSANRKSHITSERIVGRQCSYLKKKRRLSFTLVEKNSVVSNSCNYLVSNDLNGFPLLYLLGLLNSCLIEWRFRVTNSNNHVSNYEIDQLPLPPRSKHPILSNIIIESAKKLIECYSTLDFGASKIPSVADEDRLDAAIFLIYSISENEVDLILEEINESYRSTSIKEQMKQIDSSIIYDYVAATPSEREKEMIKYIPPGGNWQDIPSWIPSQRLEQIRRMAKERGGVVRTTYYGRLTWDRPSYTISTYFSRIGNGCFIHPAHDRLISLREAARLQSFRDSFKFYGSRTSKYKQIGNAVPPLLAMVIAKALGGNTLVAPFCGAGGLTEGFRMAGYRILAAQDIDLNCLWTYKMNELCPAHAIVPGDIRNPEVKQRFIRLAKEESMGEDIDVVAAGPPCKGFSLAGWFRRDDPHNELVYDYLNIIEALEPKFVVMENVQGLVWMKRGRVLEELLKAIEKLGYEVEYQVLKAEQFGVPQLRRRVIILGSSTGKPMFPRSLFAETGLDMRKPFTVKDAISDLSNIYPSTKVSETVYSKEWIQSDYQRWCRGLISTEELFRRREFPWVKAES